MVFGYKVFFLCHRSSNSTYQKIAFSYFLHFVLVLHLGLGLYLGFSLGLGLDLELGFDFGLDLGIGFRLDTDVVKGWSWPLSFRIIHLSCREDRRSLRWWPVRLPTAKGAFLAFPAF